MRSISYIVLVLLSLPAFAQTTQQAKSHSPRTVWEPPDWNFPQDVKANGQDEMLSSFRISSYEIVHGRTAMKDSQRLGGHIGSRGSDALEWLCFHGANEMGRWVLWLENDEISGLVVGAFQWWQLSESDVLDPRCQALRKEDSKITLPFPSFTLGATQSQALKSLGSPTAAKLETRSRSWAAVLTGAVQVTFGGIKATIFTVNSGSQVASTVPIGAKTGKIAIKTAGGIATSSATFTVLQ